MEDITTMIVKRLRELFGNVKIYRENVKSGFEEDSFFIPALHIKSKSELGKKHNLTFSCQVIFLPRTDHINDDIQTTMNTLLIGFLKLNNNDVFNREFVVSDDALVFTFDLVGFLSEVESGNKFEKLEMKEGENNGR